MMKIISNSLLILALLTGCGSHLTSKESKTKKSLTTTELTIGTKRYLKSAILNEERPIIISLPRDYATSDTQYPVLYVTDGLQNIWHVVGTTEVLARTGSIPPLIVVGIESTNRLRDFTLTASKNHPGSGGGKKFLDFIEKELIPFVDSHYRTNSFKVLEGHSLGGLFAASTLIEKPDLFDGFIIMSPAMWWNGEELTKRAKPFFKANPKLNKILFFGIGTYESGTEYGMRKELKNFVDVLSENCPANLRFERKEMEKEGHMSSPLLSNYYGLKFVFSDMAFPEELYKDYSDSAFLNHENNIMAKYGGSAKQSAESYVSLATSLREKKRYSEAITVLQRSVEAYPFDVGLMNYLAHTYELDNNTKGAINVYKKAIKTSEKYNYNREEEFENQINRLTNK
ncbi:MAG TPA: alpha/beta hydrolase-fold protein [Balneolaceae bacterium]|nr:alpha/beta hydrolase-fold protein [Balneolaceae bacterium]